ncbi:MAG: aminotransferase class V-fold PLP-dependent enzyme, partial [Planctomycetota bacterium]
MPEPVVYLDNHATTRTDPRVVESMLPWFTQEYGNAGSVVHPFGEAAREAVAAARDSIAASVGCDSDELVFTS